VKGILIKAAEQGYITQLGTRSLNEDHHRMHE
jgi:hypothetical protein